MEINIETDFSPGDRIKYKYTSGAFEDMVHRDAEGWILAVEVRVIHYMKDGSGHEELQKDIIYTVTDDERCYTINIESKYHKDWIDSFELIEQNK